MGTLFGKLLLVWICFLAAVNILDKVIKKMNEEIKWMRLNYGPVSRMDLAVLTGPYPYRTMGRNDIFKLLKNKMRGLGRLIGIPHYQDADGTQGFLCWCQNFLQRLGYQDITAYNGKTGFVDFVCRNGEQTVYVKCIQLKPDELTNPDARWPVVEKHQIEELVGLMVRDGISGGLVLTTGDFSGEALKYMEQLPDSLNIVHLSGCEVSSLFRRIREGEVAAFMQ